MIEIDKRKLTNRLKRVEGQVRGIGSMIDRNDYYKDILVQIAAVRSAMNSIESLLIKDHFFTYSKNLTEQERNEILSLLNTRK